MRQLITKISTQTLAMLLLLVSAAFWLGVVDLRTLVPYCIILLIFLLITHDLWLLIFLPAFVLPVLIVLLLAPHLKVLPGVRALIATTIFGVALCITTLFVTHKETDKKNRKNHNHPKK